MGDSLLVREMRACGGPAAFAAKYGHEEVAAALQHWPSVARPEQLEPDWSRYDAWFVLAGRGFGKTRTGAETVTGWARKKIAGRMALVAPTAADARDVMVEGESGILAVSERQRFPAGVRALQTPGNLAERSDGDALLGRGAEAPPRPPARRLLGRRTPMVGRRSEMAAR